MLGQQAGFYKVRSGTTETAFAANLSDLTESTIAPGREVKVDGRAAGPVAGFTIGVRREFWLYLLAAAVLLSAIEWLTYPRRWTV